VRLWNALSGIYEVGDGRDVRERAGSRQSADGGGASASLVLSTSLPLAMKARLIRTCTLPRPRAWQQPLFNALAADVAVFRDI
jgi:hypothetical protein